MLATLVGLVTRTLIKDYVLIYGGRQNGKTSLIHRLSARLSANECVCRIDGRSFAHDDETRIFTIIAEQINYTLSNAREPIKKLRHPHELDRFLNEALKKTAYRRLILIIDDIDLLPERARTQLAHTIRRLFESRLQAEYVALERLCVVMTGSVNLYRLRFVEGSPLHGIGIDPINLAHSDLSLAEVEALFACGLGESNVPGATVRAWAQAAYGWVAGHHFLTQVLGEGIAARTANGQLAREDVSPEALEDLIQEDLYNRRSFVEKTRQDVERHNLAQAVSVILGAPIPVDRNYRSQEEYIKLELLGLIKEEGGVWRPRNPLIEHTLRLITQPGDTRALRSPFRVSPRPQLTEVASALAPGEEAAISALADLIRGLQVRHLSLDEAGRRIADDTALCRLLASMVGRTLHQGQALITFGQDNQIGNVRIGEVAGGDIYHLHFTLPASRQPDAE